VLSCVFNVISPGTSSPATRTLCLFTLYTRICWTRLALDLFLPTVQAGLCQPLPRPQSFRQSPVGIDSLAVHLRRDAMPSFVHVIFSLSGNVLGSQEGFVRCLHIAMGSKPDRMIIRNWAELRAIVWSNAPIMAVEWLAVRAIRVRSMRGSIVSESSGVTRFVRVSAGVRWKRARHLDMSAPGTLVDRQFHVRARATLH
jgi:hypothetical protein